MFSLAILTTTLVDSSIAPAFAGGADPTYYEVGRGSHPHDVAAAPVSGGPVYYTAQTSGKLGILDPKSGKYERFRWARAPHRTA
jgi:virginiamycin B lyase